MSRRVFDVGLDMGRIRNGLKHNGTKESKRSKSQRSSTAPEQTSDLYTDASQPPNHQMAVVPRLQHSPVVNGHNAPDYGQPSDTITMSSPGPGKNPDFPMPPTENKSPNYVNGTGERALPSSPLRPAPDSPITTQKPGIGRNHSDTIQNFDLKPPPPNSKVKRIDILSEQLFSGEHLNVILKDPSFFLRFTAFLNRYKPRCAPLLVRYLEAQKAIKAVEYANSLAETMKAGPGEHASPCPAASIDPRFEARSKRSFEALVNDALPAYITSSLTKVVTESMVREITGTGTPVMRELVGGLAEVFCLADPSIKDCPIVYASEEFYRTTRYARDDVLGRNCRFLQGPKTDRATIARLSTATKDGQEICETVLNYRRDGSPFMNLLLTAPLYDNRGSVRYFIGAQIDVSGLIDEGRGLDSFERLLAECRPNSYRDSDQSDGSLSSKHLKCLNELGQMLSLDESSLLQQHSRASSVADGSSSLNFSARQTPSRRDPSGRLPRRVLGNDDEPEAKDRNEWALSSMGPSGKLPGVYQNYLLVRPYPSLRIIFVSPALRIPGLLQSPFLSRIGGPAHVRDGLSDAFEQGAAVTAKVTWLPLGRSDSSEADGNADSSPSSRRGPHAGGDNMRTRYISCTPLLGSDDQVGVWMVVMVENELVTGSLASRERALARYNGEPVPPTPSEYEREDLSSAGDSSSKPGFERSRSGHVRSDRKDKPGSEGGRLYAEFMKNGGVNGGGGAPGKTSMEPVVDGVNGIGMTSGEGRFEELASPVEEKREMF